MDDLPEALEDPRLRFALGVQWHPEADATSRFVAALVTAAAARRASASSPPATGDASTKNLGRFAASRPRAGKGRTVADNGNRGESRRTVFVALAANAAIALAKLAGGLAAGSSAMLSEAAHSTADTMNQVFLLVSLSFSERKPDVEHPFGYGKERFFWSFMAAVTIFVAGAVFSALQGIERITASGSEKESFGIAYAVLGFALVAESISLARAISRRGPRRTRPIATKIEFVRRSRDPTTKTVLFEDNGRGRRRPASRWPASPRAQITATRRGTAWRRGDRGAARRAWRSALATRPTSC